MPREREVEAQFPRGARPGHRTLQAEHGLDLSLGCFLQLVSLRSAQCTATHSSPALSDDSLGKRTEERATMHFARHPFSKHICTHLLSCRPDIYLGGRGGNLPTSWGIYSLFAFNFIVFHGSLFCFKYAQDARDIKTY